MSAVALTSFPSGVRAANPIVQTIYSADAAPMVHDGRVYVYTGHDEDVLVNDFFTMNEWRVFSTTDMVNWTDHRSPLSYHDFSWATGDAWAGQTIEKDGKFYFYVTLSVSSGARVIGVGVSDSPTGPFEDALGAPLVQNAGCGDIDPSVITDDDGTTYMYWGNPRVCYVVLSDDMISYEGSVVQVPMTAEAFGSRTGDPDHSTQFEEAPWLYKRDSTYYMIFAAGGIPEYLAYSTGPSVTGPWTYQGEIMPTQGGAFTNHPGIIHFHDKAFLFYHNAALPGGEGFKRSVAVEEFDYNVDGTIPVMNMTDEGASAVDTLSPFQRVEGETIAWTEGVETEECTEGGMNVTSIDSGDWIRVENADFGTGAMSFEASVASDTGGGSLELRLDAVDGPLVGTCDVGNTGGWQAWVMVSCDVEEAEGLHDLYLTFSGGSGELFNLDYWQFVPKAPPSGTGGTGGASASGGAGGTFAGAGGTDPMAGGSSSGNTGGASSSSGGAASGSGGASSGSGGEVGSGASLGAGGTNPVGGTASGGTGPETGNPGGDSGGCQVVRAPARTSAVVWWALGLVFLVHRRRKNRFQPGMGV